MPAFVAITRYARRYYDAGEPRPRHAALIVEIYASCCFSLWMLPTRYAISLIVSAAAIDTARHYRDALACLYAAVDATLIIIVATFPRRHCLLSYATLPMLRRLPLFRFIFFFFFFR